MAIIKTEDREVDITDQSLYDGNYGWTAVSAARLHRIRRIKQNDSSPTSSDDYVEMVFLEMLHNGPVTQATVVNNGTATSNIQENLADDTPEDTDALMWGITVAPIRLATQIDAVLNTGVPITAQDTHVDRRTIAAFPYVDMSAAGRSMSVPTTGSIWVLVAVLENNSAAQPMSEQDYLTVSYLPVVA